MRRPLKLLAYFFIVLAAIAAVAAVCCFKLYDTTPYAETEAYRRQMEGLKNLPPEKLTTTKDTIQVGWAKVNLAPPFTTPIAIDAHRKGHFQGVHDSVYVRAFVFKAGGKKVAYISADLLIIPPNVAAMFDTLMQQQGYSRDNIFFTATHTHSSIGAWYNTVVGRIFTGKYDERVPPHIANCIKQAIINAEQNVGPAEIGFGSFPTTKLVFNRLVGDSGTVDSMLRVVKIKKLSGATAAIISFSAHATVYHESMMQLSGDWPAVLMRQLEDSGIVNFASFSAGAVGSHGPYEFSKEQLKEVEYMAGGVGKIVASGNALIPTRVFTTDSFLFGMQRMQLFLREPNLRLSNSVALRAWLFNKLFGNEPVYVLQMRLGNLLFIGTPCDFSGELTGQLDSAAKAANTQLTVTGFNGSYIGYVTSDQWNELNKYETRTMNWFGPGTGSYMQQVISRLITKNE